METCEKHDDQMREWIMCFKAAKEIYDSAFLNKNTYEVPILPAVIFSLAKELYQERTRMRYTVLHKEDSPEYLAERRLGRIVLNAQNIMSPGDGEVIIEGETDG